MRIHKAPLMAAVVAVTMGATACSENGAAITAPEEASFQRQTNRQATVGNLIAALNNVNVNIQDFQALNNLTIQNIRVVNVEDVLNNANINILNNSQFLNNIQILQDFLNNSLNNNNVQILNNALSNNTVVIGDVVAIDVLSGGDVIVFVQ